MLVLIGCEESQTVCKELRKLGHEAYSCDLQDCSGGHPEWHLQMDIRKALSLKKWDLFICHPPCTFLSNSSSKHLYINGRKENGINKERWENMEEACNFFNEMLMAPVKKKCLENPIQHGHARERIKLKWAQLIQPWMFGHMESKGTCLWLYNLPKLRQTNNVYEEMQKLPPKEKYRIWWIGGGKKNSKIRSKTYEEIAKAMAEQWG